MKKWFLWMLFITINSATFSQDIVVNKLRSETSRTIKKDTDTSRWTWKKEVY